MDYEPLVYPDVSASYTSSLLKYMHAGSRPKCESNTRSIPLHGTEVSMSMCICMCDSINRRIAYLIPARLYRAVASMHIGSMPVQVSRAIVQ